MRRVGADTVPHAKDLEVSSVKPLNNNRPVEDLDLCFDAHRRQFRLHGRFDFGHLVRRRHTGDGEEAGVVVGRVGRGADAVHQPLLIAIDEVIDAAEKGTLNEAFASGTAAIVSPVGMIFYKGKEYNIRGGRIGELTEKLYNEILQIQYGEKEDPFGWNLVVQTAQLAKR